MLNTQSAVVLTLAGQDREARVRVTVVAGTAGSAGSRGED
jgi:hypothetical protein